jgi:hypothetical protein
MIEGYSDLPEGEVLWDEDEENVIVPGGRPAAEAVAGIVRDLGHEVSEFEMDLEHYSWIFAMKAGAADLLVHVFHLDAELHVNVNRVVPRSIPADAPSLREALLGLLPFGRARRERDARRAKADEKEMTDGAAFRGFTHALVTRLADDPRFRDISWSALAD